MLNYIQKELQTRATNALYESPLAVAIAFLKAHQHTHTRTHLTDRFAQHDRQTRIHALLNYFTFFRC